MVRNNIMVEKQQDYLSHDNTNCLKGIFAVFILIHHLYQYSGLFDDSTIGLAFQALGYLSVGMFFFYTGYGLMVSKNKIGYVKVMGRRRILPLYLFYVFLIIFYTAWRLILHYSVSHTDIIQSFLFGKTIVPLGWYLQATFIIYLLLWGVFIIVKKDSECLSITVIVLVLYCVICNMCGLASTWYESILCVVLGMSWAVYKDKIDNLLDRKPWRMCLASAFLFLIFVAGTKISPVLNIEIKMISAVIFSAFITVATYVFPKFFYNNYITRVLGKYSLEIYVSQGFFLLLRKGGSIYIDNPYFFICIVIMGTGLMSLVMKLVYERISKKIKCL